LFDTLYPAAGGLGCSKDGIVQKLSGQIRMIRIGDLVMKKPLAAVTNPTRIVTVLCVSPLAEDYFSLQAFFNHSKWELHKADSLASALPVIRRREIGVVICERYLSQGNTWIDMLDELRLLQDAPPLIVTSRNADERLWAEALNLGAYDVLAKPFERKELVRSVSMAWLHWHHRRDRREAPDRVMQAMQAAS
jgi:DNA-binding NtrC family response regulator